MFTGDLRTLIKTQLIDERVFPQRTTSLDPYVRNPE